MLSTHFGSYFFAPNLLYVSSCLCVTKSLGDASDCHRFHYTCMVVCAGISIRPHICSHSSECGGSIIILYSFLVDSCGGDVCAKICHGCDDNYVLE